MYFLDGFFGYSSTCFILAVPEKKNNNNREKKKIRIGNLNEYFFLSIKERVTKRRHTNGSDPPIKKMHNLGSYLCFVFAVATCPPPVAAAFFCAMCV